MPKIDGRADPSPRTGVLVERLRLIRCPGDPISVVEVSAIKSRGVNTYCYKRDLPHSKQRTFSRDVINPQDGHILCDPYRTTICGFSLYIL